MRNRTSSRVIAIAVMAILLGNGTASLKAEDTSLADPIAKTILAEPDPSAMVHAGSRGLLLQGMQAAWYNSANGEYFRYEKQAADAYLKVMNDAGNDSAPDPWEDGLLGEQLLLLYQVTRDQVYFEAATKLRDRLVDACAHASAKSAQAVRDDRTPCMAQAFLAGYAIAMQHPQELAGIAEQFDGWQMWLDRPAQKTAAKNAQHTMLLRARLLAALVDSLPCYPLEDANRARLVEELRKEAAVPSLRRELMAEPKKDGAAVSIGKEQEVGALLAVYALLKGVRLGYLPVSDAAFARDLWHRAYAKRAGVDETNGALLLAATEVDLAEKATLGRGQTIVLDGWFNSQKRKNAAGEQEYFHYKWQDYSDSGYALLGHIFRSFGVSTDTLYAAPTRAKLSNAQYYMIVSPDIPVKNPNPHYMTEEDADEIAAWVREGGVLVLMENDPPNADIAHLNLLADKFGLHFEDVLHHHVLNDPARGDHIEDGTIPVAGGGPLFHDPHTLYMKDTCAISLSGSADALLKDRGDVVMASARYGKGMVFAAVDAWAYNEYTDGRKNPAVYGKFDNFAGARELVQWLLKQHASLGGASKRGVR